ncbi:MAG: hypothetical protein K2H46_06950 [Muribaculaceae bacterium]|nr:hypothetical protein [Muribaculaceae bacterium]
MKTKTLLTRISAAALFAAAAMLPAALTSCSSEAEPAPVKEDPIPEGMARINLSFAAPTMEAGTRGDENAVSAEEGALKSLWVYFFKQGSGTSELKYAFSIPVSGTSDGSDNVFSTGATLKKIEKVTTSATDIITGMNVEPATYHIYVLANLADKCSDLDPTNYESIKESDVTGATYTTTDGTFALASGLPMAADKTDLTNVTNATYSTSDGNLEVSSGSVSLTANMTILCSKVRYTLFFDCTDSNAISWPYQSFSLTSTNLNNPNTADGVFTTPEKTAYTTAVSLSPSRYNYPTGDLDDTWFSNSDSSYQADLTGDGGTSTKQYAYQGYVYLNEDPSLAETDKTKIKFNATLGVAGTTGSTENRTFTVVLPNKATTNADANKLCKGTYYDVVGKITGAGFDVKVAIIDWAKAPTDTFEF